MKTLGLAALLAVLPASAQPPEGTPPIQRYLGGLHLGDTLEDVQRIYPPARKWPSYVEPRGRVMRIRVERDYAKSFPSAVQTLWLGFSKGRLAEIQLVYDTRFSSKKPAEVIAGDLALIYGDPRHSNDKFWWSDGRTVLRVFYAELSALKDGAQSVELRTSIQILERGLFGRAD